MRSGVEGTFSPHNDLPLRVISALVLAPFTVLVAYIGGWLFVVFWCAAAIGAFCEWTKIVASSVGALVCGVGALAISAVLIATGSIAMAVVVLIAGAALVGVVNGGEKAGWCALGLLYAGVILAGPATLRRDAGYGFLTLVLLFGIVWATDIFAYFGGRIVGGPRLWLRISPNKTWSGAIAGAGGAVIVALAIAHYAHLANLFAIGILALLLSVCSQVGDLLESAFKRRFGVKDASHVIPGHGGIMDRIDGFLAAACIAAIIGLARGGLDAPARGLLIW